MKKAISILVLGALPVFALAAGAHDGGHAMPGMEKGMAGMQKSAATESSIGKAGDASKISRTIEVSMDDTMRFTPSKIAVKEGETIRFFVKNGGKVAHEMVIGSMEDMKSHAAMMQKMPDMKHAEPNMVTLQPGQRGGIVWEFSKAGAVDFACLIPGHMEAGMVGKVSVE